MRLALYQPDIAQNTGTMLRLAACLGVPVDLIEPCGFVFGGPKLRRAGMDYLDQVTLLRHNSWTDFLQWRRDGGSSADGRLGRLILLTTKTTTRYDSIAYRTNDTFLLGRESAGVPEDVHEAADLRVTIPMQPGFRSLNVALAAAMVLGEALRQTDWMMKQKMDE